MDRKKIILILGAAWLSAALLTWFLYAATKAPRIEKTTSVVAAARDIPAGTLLRKEDLTTIAVRDREIPGHRHSRSQTRDQPRAAPSRFRL